MTRKFIDIRKIRRKKVKGLYIPRLDSLSWTKRYAVIFFSAARNQEGIAEAVSYLDRFHCVSL